MSFTKILSLTDAPTPNPSKTPIVIPDTPTPIPQTNIKIITPQQRLKEITNRIKNSQPVKRPPPEITNPPENDPTIRKKTRLEHPLNIMLKKKLQEIATDKAEPPQDEPSVPTQPGDYDPKNIPTISNAANTSSISDTTTVSTGDIATLDLALSSDSEIEDGEINSPRKSSTPNHELNNIKPTNVPIRNIQNDLICTNKTVPANQTPNPIGDQRTKPITDRRPPQWRDDEYVPKPITTNRRPIPPYQPTPPEGRKTQYAPINEVLFDIYKIVQKLDQDVGRSMYLGLKKYGHLKN